MPLYNGGPASASLAGTIAFSTQVCLLEEAKCEGHFLKQALRDPSMKRAKRITPPAWIVEF